MRRRDDRVRTPRGPCLGGAWAAALALCGCSPLGAAPGAPALPPAEQASAADRIARAFTGACLSAPDAETAVAAIQAQGWPAFRRIWSRPDSVFYATRPGSDTPVRLLITSDRTRPGPARPRLSCVSHYVAGDAAPMVAAFEQRWGASRPGPRGGRVWSFRRSAAGALAAAPIREGAGAETLAAALSALQPGDALVYAQVTYTAGRHDVAALVTVRRQGG